MIIDIKGTKLVFTKNEIDGLYYTRMKRIREGDEVQYCNEISTINESKDDDNWKVVEQSSKKKWPKLDIDEAHSLWGHPHYAQMNKMANFYKVHLWENCQNVQDAQW